MCTIKYRSEWHFGFYRIGYRKSSQPNWPLLTFFKESVINVRKEVAHLMTCFSGSVAENNSQTGNLISGLDINLQKIYTSNCQTKWPFETYMEKQQLNRSPNDRIKKQPTDFLPTVLTLFNYASIASSLIFLYPAAFSSVRRIRFASAMFFAVTYSTK